MPKGNSWYGINQEQEAIMKAEFTAIIEAAPEGGYWAICPEVPGANGQGETIEKVKNSLRQAIELILEDRRADILRGLPEDAIQEKVQIG
jgi:predicted RNase H-like HicB family nuclease